jgi:hypothetical protein
MTIFFIDLIWIKDIKKNIGTIFFSIEKLFWKDLKYKRFIQINNKNIKQILMKNFRLLKLFFKRKNFFMFEFCGFAKVNYFLFDFFFKKIFGKPIFLEKKHGILLNQLESYFLENFLYPKNLEKSYLTKSLMFKINNNFLKNKFKKNQINYYYYFDNEKERIERFCKNFFIIFWHCCTKEIFIFKKILFRGFLDFSSKSTIKKGNFIFSYSKTEFLFKTFDFELLNLRIFFKNINKLAMNSVFLNAKKAFVIHLRSKFLLADKFFRILEISEESNERVDLKPNLIKNGFVQIKIFFFISSSLYLPFLIKIHANFRIPIFIKNSFLI